MFALTVWAACAVATFPAAVPATADTHQGIFENRVERARLYETLSPSQRDLATVSACWAASRMRVQQAWQLAGVPRPALVAVLDTGIDSGHPGLTGRVDGSLCLVSGAAPVDMLGHGTHVAVTIAAIAPNCTILSIKVADDRGCCTAKAVAEGIGIASRWGASVINLSLEVESTPELETAVRAAWEQGAVVVAAAGMPRNPTPQQDVSRDAPVYPAAYPNVIAVAGTDRWDSPAPLTNRASWVDVAAPSDRTVVYSHDGQIDYLTGTSTAAAHVSGVAALLCGLAIDRNGNGCVNDEVRQAIESTADRTDSGGMGQGIVNALAALEWLLS